MQENEQEIRKEKKKKESRKVARAAFSPRSIYRIRVSLFSCLYRFQLCILHLQNEY